jgi:hypothetical protein
MADGSTKPISEVRIGDRVLATDPTTGRTEAQPVIDVIVGEGAKDLVEITVDTDGDAGNETGTVTATDEHPFWVDSLDRWVDAKDLKAGYRFETTDHRSATVVGTRSWSQHQRVYNLTVDRIHTYFVVAGDADALVHNSDLCPRHDLEMPNVRCNGQGRKCRPERDDELFEPQRQQNDIEERQRREESSGRAVGQVQKAIQSAVKGDASGLEMVVLIPVIVVHGSKRGAQKAADWLRRRGR